MPECSFLKQKKPKLKEAGTFKRDAVVTGVRRGEKRLRSERSAHFTSSGGWQTHPGLPSQAPHRFHYDICEELDPLRNSNSGAT